MSDDYCPCGMPMPCAPHKPWADAHQIKCGYCGGDHPPCYPPLKHTWICRECDLTFATARAQKAHAKVQHSDGSDD